MSRTLPSVPKIYYPRGVDIYGQVFVSSSNTSDDESDDDSNEGYKTDEPELELDEVCSRKSYNSNSEKVDPQNYAVENVSMDLKDPPSLLKKSSLSPREGLDLPKEISDLSKKISTSPKEVYLSNEDSNLPKEISDLSKEVHVLPKECSVSSNTGADLPKEISISLKEISDSTEGGSTSPRKGFTIGREGFKSLTRNSNLPKEISNLPKGAPTSQKEDSDSSKGGSVSTKKSSLKETPSPNNFPPQLFSPENLLNREAGNKIKIMRKRRKVGHISSCKNTKTDSNSLKRDSNSSESESTPKKKPKKMLSTMPLEKVSLDAEYSVKESTATVSSVEEDPKPSTSTSDKDKTCEMNISEEISPQSSTSKIVLNKHENEEDLNATLADDESDVDYSNKISTLRKMLIEVLPNPKKRKIVHKTSSTPKKKPPIAESSDSYSGGSYTNPVTDSDHRKDKNSDDSSAKPSDKENRRKRKKRKKKVFMPRKKKDHYRNKREKLLRRKYRKSYRFPSKEKGTVKKLDRHRVLKNYFKKFSKIENPWREQVLSWIKSIIPELVSPKQEQKEINVSKLSADDYFYVDDFDNSLDLAAEMNVGEEIFESNIH